MRVQVSSGGGELMGSTQGNTSYVKNENIESLKGILNEHL